MWYGLLVYFRNLVSLFILPVPLYSDNTSALQIAANPIFHERTKHININCHFIKEKIQDDLLVTNHLSSAEQHVDVSNKEIGKGPHSNLMFKMGMKNIFIAPNWKKEINKCINVP
ncbi:hypothetical protein MTR67_022823 [Solanum verrucosum]|uniref:Copia protein n=1 Tax=Solanum verrucosum TaxID=315347 RepID=A0AAF0TY70_SOLVR|nr:hypothetical protein MTR67_022823 [Solanum verrucosum]